MVQLILTILIYLIMVIPVGIYVYHIAAGKHTFADPVFNRVDGFIYKISGIRPQRGMSWKKYAAALLGTNGVMILLGYIILRIQSLPIFNPNAIGNMEESLSFNTIISFMTNTNLQHYSGESGLSYLSQMLVITFMMFVSAASGYAACVAFIRGLAGKNKDNVGNFFVDLVRITTRVLIPFSIIGGLLLVWQGVPQNLSGNIVVDTLEGAKQVIATGPAAALEIIKHLGTNGGGFIGANSTTPIENPTIITNLIELYSMMLLPGASVITFGKMVRDRKRAEKKNIVATGATSPLKQSPIRRSLTVFMYGREGRTIFAAMGIIFLIGLGVCYWAELQGNPVLADSGLSQSMGSMEGKEVRFGIAQSAMFTTTTTSFTTGTVNNMHDTLTPLGGMIPLLHMMLNVVFGGKGVGLMNMIMYAILAVFICGLMIGRTPEYLGKKIEGREMKLTALCIIIHPFLILAFSALAIGLVNVLPDNNGITNPGFHGLSQVLYEFSSSAANNGSGFEGLADNTMFWNITTGLAMFFGRYLSIVIQLAIAGSLMKKNFVNDSVGTLHTDTFSFAIILVFVVYIFAALTFFPVLALGPIAEHLTLWS
ncbi:potassium-transporting ATPase subunit KdpA [[Clostridium] leptum]|uniref:Potassium-transporting ATPase potassium-binding subunit n=1 Tax=Solibaculum mannosilyticum TaxID=2780922 RepID=A0A7I8D5W6_9FIRM|nr:potassium-transporting ATPase subunit KdpA [Solibaculum mannosilyticum]MCO7136483.1 potassium-transporting ATPase subunit KdpA [[Clostridium] leptum]BCI60064.1 potassium-transporting ATPase potassium-binding subunit [Solibaculum mannosilyticum]